MLKVPGSIVSVDWLFSNIDNPNLILFDGTIQKVTDKDSASKTTSYIKNAQFFDIKKEFSLVEAPFPNTMISAEEFQYKVRKLGVTNTSCIVVYDRYGYYSCARVWGMFRAMGFENIAVLDGGLPAWNDAGFPTQNTEKVPDSFGDFTSNFNSSMIHNHVPVLEAIDKPNITIVDARGANRFYARVEEPRPGLRSGHIPNAKNIPYTSLLNGVKMKSKSELQEIFSKVENEHLIFSCGSGITACVLALGADLAGVKRTSVYDGSWTEWGSLPELPIEK